MCDQCTNRQAAFERRPTVADLLIFDRLPRRVQEAAVAAVSMLRWGETWHVCRAPDAGPDAITRLAGVACTLEGSGLLDLAELAADVRAALRELTGVS